MASSFTARRLALSALLAFLVPLAPLAAQYEPLPGDVDLSRAMENAEVREAFRESWLLPPPAKTLTAKPRVVETDSGPVLLETIRHGDHLYYAIINGRNGKFARYSQGSWIFKRRISDGAWVQAKVFLRSDPGTFLRIYPAGKRSSMDVIVFGSVLRRGVALPVPFAESPSMAARGQASPVVLNLSLASVISLTGDGFDWSTFAPAEDLYSGGRDLVQSVRESLGLLEYRDDGAWDETVGNAEIATALPVKGATSGKLALNCSGFVKWLLDSMLAAHGTRAIALETAKTRLEDVRGTSFSASYEEVEDPYFGLDWTRNLALAYNRAVFPNRKNAPTDFDVRENAFALRADIREVLNTQPEYVDYPGYAEHQGFRIDGLKAMLYLLAVREPGNFYLGAFNREETVRNDEKGRTFSLRKFYHVAAFFPYFLPSGEFRIAMFESCEETDFDQRIAGKEQDYIHLVRIQAEPGFKPVGTSR